MKDKDKAKEELLEELGKLRQKLRKLEAAKTKQKQKEQIYKESEEKYKLLVETSTDMIFTVDLKGNFLFVNKAFKKILGYSSEDIKNINGFALVHPEDLPEVIKQFGGLVEGRKVDNMEYRYKTKKGTYIHILNNASPIFDAQGNVVAAFGIARDISQRKKMEEELQRAHDELERRVYERTAELVSINKKLEKEIKERKKIEEELIRLSTAVKISVDGVIIADLDANIIDVNEAVLKKHGFQHKEEMVGKNSFQFIAPEDREKLLPAIKKMAQKGYIERVEYRILTRDGRKIAVEANGVILRGKDGHPKGFVVTVRDITERKRVEEALRESEENYRQLAHSIADVFFEMDKNLRYTYWNKASENLTGISAKNALGKSLYELFPDVRGTKVDKFYRKALKTNKSISFVNEYPLNDRNYFFEITAYPSKRGLSVFVKDITERKKAEEEIKGSEERLKILFQFAPDAYYLNDLKGNFIDGNIATEKLMGYKREELIGKNFLKLKLLPPVQIPKAASLLVKNARGQATGPDEFDLTRKDGTQVSVEIRTFPVKIEGKTVVLGIAHDITQRKKTRQVLKESEEKFRNLAEQSPNMIFIHKKGRIVYANKKCEEIMGYKREELYSPDFYFLTLIARESKDLIRASFIKHEKGQDIPPYEYTLVTKEDLRIEAIITTRLINYDGERAILGIITDITEHKSTEQELRIKDWAIKSSISAIALADLEGNLMYVNDSFLRLWGYEDEKEVIGKSALKFWRAEDEALKVIESLHDKWNWIGELEAVKKDGSTFDAQLSASMVSDANGKPIFMMASFIDITERKRAEKVQTSLYKISEAAHSAKNLEELYCSIHNIINELMPANNFYIALYDSTSKTLSFPYFVDEYEQNPGPQKLGKGLTEYVLRTEKPLLASPKVFNDLKKRGEVISVGPPSIDWLGVPLKTTDKTIGVLTVQSYTKGIRFSEKDKSILTFISEQVAMAIERKKIERELKESEERYKDLVEKADIAILIDDKDGNIEYFNEKLLDLLGYSVEEVRKMSIQSIVHPDDVDRVMQYHQGRLQGKKVPSRYEFKGIRKDGSIIYLEVDAVKQKEKGEIIGSRSYIWDITERKRAERELQESMELFQKTFISQQDAIFLLDANQPPLIIDCNPAAMKIFGYTRLEMLDRSSAFLHVNQTMLKKFQAQLYPVIEKSGFLFLPEFKMKRKNGTVFPSEHSVIPLKNEQGKRIGWVSVIRDITERKRAEEVLKESEEKFRNLAEQSPNMIFIHKKDQVVYANKKCEEMMGYKREEFYSPDFDFMTLIAPESKNLIRASFKKHKKGQNIPPYEYTLVNKDGKRIEAILTSQLINYKGESAILGIVTDITEHKIAEEKYRSLYSAMNEGVCLHEIDYDDKGKVVDYRFTDINPAYESITGLKKEKAIGSKASQLYGTANPPFLNIFAKVAETGEPASIETYFPPLKKYFIISAFSPEKGKFATVFTDITERYNTERELIEAKDQAETALKKLEKVQSQLIQSERLAALGKLSAGIAHEINNPLSIISGHAQILLMEKSPSRAELKKTVEIIEKQVDRASSITDQLLQFSKRIKPKLKKSDVNEILKDTLALLKQQLSQDNIKIVKQLSSKPVFIQADSLQLQQVFLNLIANASHAMPNGGTLTINTIVEDTNLEISFTDSGCGIPERNLSKLFEPFFTTKENGTGLGLSIAYGIIKAHKGDIKVKSEEGKGATFTIILPYE